MTVPPAFHRLHASFSAASRARTTIASSLVGPEGRCDFTLSWDGSEVFRVAHDRDVFACRVPFGDGASLALRRMLGIVARSYGFGFSTTFEMGRAAVHVAGVGSRIMLPGTWVLWSRNMPRGTSLPTNDDAYLSDRMAELDRTYPRRPIIAST